MIYKYTKTIYYKTKNKYHGILLCVWSCQWHVYDANPLHQLEYCM
jgi:hypothetical protein